MMRGDQIRAAGTTAGNVVSALERLNGDDLAAHPQEAAIGGLMRELVAVMPTRFDGVLAAACNRYLATLPDQDWAGPRVKTVSMVDESVTMRAAQGYGPDPVTTWFGPVPFGVQPERQARRST